MTSSLAAARADDVLAWMFAPHMQTEPRVFLKRVKGRMRPSMDPRV
jgi:hypothetical protein